MCARAPSRWARSFHAGLPARLGAGAHPPPALLRLRAGVGARREGAPGALASRPRSARAQGQPAARVAGARVRASARQPPLGRSSRWPSPPSPGLWGRRGGARPPPPRVPRWGRSGDGGSSSSEVSEPERERPCGGHGRPGPRPQPGRHRPVRPAGERRPQPRSPARDPGPSLPRLAPPRAPALCRFPEPVRSPPCAALPHTCLPPLPCCWDSESPPF